MTRIQVFLGHSWAQRGIYEPALQLFVHPPKGFISSTEVDQVFRDPYSDVTKKTVVIIFLLLNAMSLSEIALMQFFPSFFFNG